MVLAMVAEGLPLDTRVEGKEASGLRLGSYLALRAAEVGDELLFDRLRSQNYLRDVSPARLQDTLASGVGCSPAILKSLVEAGADPKSAHSGGAALTRLRGSSGVCKGRGEQQLLAMAATLIGLGAPVDARDEMGWTVLMGCDSPGLAELLLKHGADPNAHDADGYTPALSTDDDRVALIVLRAGGDPRARNSTGSVRDNARKRHMPATLHWLDEHGVT